ncbi:MAG: RNB domain-containing ribonuclease, partial [Pseudomonadales bacterium]
MKSTRLKAPDVLKMIAELPQPVSWRQLVDQAGAVTPREITQLRQMLRGLERNGELTKAPDGSYIIAAAVESEVGMVEGRGRKLTVAGYPIASGQNLPLRVGDKVAYTLVADEVRIQDVVAFNPDPIAGVLQWEGRYPYVEAIGGLRGRIGLPEDPDASHGDTVSVEITGRDRRGVVGRVIERMERDNVLDEAISTALIAHQIPHEWPQAVTDAADRLPNSVHPDDFPKRRRITDMPLVTIDGETAKDFDDAVYAEQHKGGWRLVVAIADVAHYVKPDSPLDDEAVIRGTSVYFPERVVPMLPEAISNGLCSLKPEVARLALVCDMQVNRRGEVVEHDFFEAVIFSHA